MSEPQSHVHEIDRLKGIAILAVIGIHVTARWGMPPSRSALAVDLLLAPAVPAFFFASGFLQSRDTPFPSKTVRKWATRLLPAYFLASLAAFAVRYGVYPETLSARQVTIDLLLANAQGTYYYVFVLCLLLGLSLLLARVWWLAPALFVAFVSGPIWVATGYDPITNLFPGNLTVGMRSPVQFAGYYLAGWLIARHYAAIRNLRWVRVIAPFVYVAFLGWLFIRQDKGFALSPFNTVLSVGIVYAAIATILTVARDQPTRGLRWLSESSYGIYLWHAPLVFWLSPGGFVGQWEQGRAFLIALCACVGSGLIVQMINPQWARTLFGVGNGRPLDRATQPKLI